MNGLAIGVGFVVSFTFFLRLMRAHRRDCEAIWKVCETYKRISVEAQAGWKKALDMAGSTTETNLALLAQNKELLRQLAAAKGQKKENEPEEPWGRAEDWWKE